MLPVLLQTELKTKGFYNGGLDGDIGPQSNKAIEAYLAKFTSLVQTGWSAWGASRKQVAAAQLVLLQAGYEVGHIDGLAGESTRYCTDLYEAKLPWRDPAMLPQSNDDRMPTPVKTIWPQQKDVVKFFGEAGTNQVMLVPPYTLFYDGTPIKKMSINKKVHDSAMEVLTRVAEIYGRDELDKMGLNTIKAPGIDVYAGCLNIRKMRGGSAASMHSFGIAIDFDPNHNQLKWGRDKARFAKPEYNEWWDEWTKQGWLSLGKARNFDWMHVQAARL